MKIGIIRETKIPVDHRVALTPLHCQELLKTFPAIEIFAQPSDIRCFADKEYQQAGVILQEDLSNCDFLFGVKEVKIEALIPDKTYFFFSHTIKKQPYNKTLLQQVIAKGVQLVDYECLKGTDGKRVVAFGRWAGIVGAYNGLRAYGLKHNLFQLKPAHQCFDRKDMWSEFSKIKLPNIKILVTGAGRVTKGAQEVLDGVGIKNVSMPEYATNNYNEPVYIQLDSDAYNRHKDGKSFEYEHFYKNPTEYVSTFGQYTSSTDLLIAGAYWDPKAPVLFTLKDLESPDFKINTIADITCDIEGSIPTTVKATTIAEPFYDYNHVSNSVENAFSSTNNITVMSVDNLPCELPRDASVGFGDMLVEHVLNPLLTENDTTIIEQASITKQHKLTPLFSYLSDYIA